MLTSLPTELVVMVLKRLGVSHLFVVRRVSRMMKREAEALLAKRKELVVSVLCCRTQTAVLTPGISPSPVMCLLLPDSGIMRLMPAVRKLLVWPRFHNDQDGEERKLYEETVCRLLNQWSETLLCAEVITAKDHRMDLTLPQLPHLLSFAMTHVTSNTMQSLLSSALRVQEIVYLRSEFQCEKLSPGWKVVEKASDGNVTPDTKFLDALCQHQTEWEMEHKLAAGPDSSG